MSKVRLKFKSVSEIKGTDDVGLLVLVDEDESRQLSIACDRNMLYQFGLRISGRTDVSTLLPEVLWQALTNDGDDRYEILIHDLIDGQYRALLCNDITLQQISMRASDAVLLAYISGLPVYIDERLMAKQSVEYTQGSGGISLPVNTLSDEMLQSALDKAVEAENYELASYLRDEINRRKKRN